MDQNSPKFIWTEAKHHAAALVAADDLSDEQICAEIGIGAGRTTLKRWKAVPEFAARVQELIAVADARALEHGIAQRPKRVAYLNDIWRRGQRLIAARAEEHAAISGGDTGLLVRQVKLSARGDEVEEYVVDTGLLKELRETHKQAAQELGQWVDKNALTDAEGKTLPIEALMERYASARTRSPDDPA